MFYHTIPHAICSVNAGAAESWPLAARCGSLARRRCGLAEMAPPDTPKIQYICRDAGMCTAGGQYLRLYRAIDARPLDGGAEDPRSSRIPLQDSASQVSLPLRYVKALYQRPGSPFSETPGAVLSYIDATKTFNLKAFCHWPRASG